MARAADTILRDGFSQFSDAPMVDISKSAQNGPMPNYAGWVGNAAYIRKSVVCILLEAPTGFQYLPNPSAYITTLKALFEEQAQTISGLDSQYETAWEETSVGGAGEVQEDLAKVTRRRSQPQFMWVEKAGMPISRFFTTWIDQLMQDPNTNYAGVVSLTNRPLDLLPDFDSATALFFEPDPTFQFVYKAWLCCNMKPKSNGDAWQGSRDLTQQGQRAELQIEFTALTQTGRGVIGLAQKILNRMNNAGMNPTFHKAHLDDISADVDATGNGYADSLDKRARDQVR